MNIREYAWINAYIREYSWIYAYIREYTRICVNKRVYTWIFVNIREYTRIFAFKCILLDLFITHPYSVLIFRYESVIYFFQVFFKYSMFSQRKNNSQRSTNMRSNGWIAVDMLSPPSDPAARFPRGLFFSANFPQKSPPWFSGRRFRRKIIFGEKLGVLWCESWFFRRNFGDFYLETWYLSRIFGEKLGV